MNENTTQLEQIPTEAPLTEVELLQAKIREMQGELDFYKCTQSNFNLLLNVVEKQKAICVKTSAGAVIIAVITSCHMHDTANVMVHTELYMRMFANVESDGDSFTEILNSDSLHRKHSGTLIIGPSDIITVIDKATAVNRIIKIKERLHDMYNFANYGN